MSVSVYHKERSNYMCKIINVLFLCAFIVLLYVISRHWEILVYFVAVIGYVRANCLN